MDGDKIDQVQVIEEKIQKDVVEDAVSIDDGSLIIDLSDPEEPELSLVVAEGGSHDEEFPLLKRKIMKRALLILCLYGFASHLDSPNIIFSAQWIHDFLGF